MPRKAARAVLLRSDGIWRQNNEKTHCKGFYRMVLLWKHLRDLRTCIHMFLVFISMISCTVTQFSSQKVFFPVTAVLSLNCYLGLQSVCSIWCEDELGFYQSSHWILIIKKKTDQRTKTSNFKNYYYVQNILIFQIINLYGIKTGMYLHCCPFQDRHWTQQSGAVFKELREQNQGIKSQCINKTREQQEVQSTALLQLCFQAPSSNKWLLLLHSEVA